MSLSPRHSLGPRRWPSRRSLPAGAALLALIAAGPPARAQTWSRTLGGTSSGEAIVDVIEADDRTLLAIGFTESFGGGGRLGWLLHLEGDGTLLAERVVGRVGALGGVEGGAVRSDGVALVTGRTVIDLFTKHDAWAVQVRPDGTVDWSTRFTREGFGRHFIVDASPTQEGGWLVAGSTSTIDTPPIFAWVVKLRGDGVVEWQGQYGSGQAESAEAAAATADGGAVVAGWTTAEGLTELWVMKVDFRGDAEWQSVYGPGQGTDVVQLADGGYAVAAQGDSFTASGRAPWVLRLDDAGSLLWHGVFGDDDWGDVQGITQAPSGEVIAFGRIGEPGFPSNDLWMVALDEATGDVLWQRAHEGAQGDWGEVVAPLVGGDLLFGATWAWGFSGEEAWLLRTDGTGQVAGCPIVRDTDLVRASPRLAVRDGTAARVPPEPMVAELEADTGVSHARLVDRCVGSCPPLSCDGVVVEPASACEGTELTATALVGGGEGALAFSWDLDGDGVEDATGNPVTWMPGAGTWSVRVTVTDSCTGDEKTCASETLVDVAPSDPPGELSDVRAGAPPLLVSESGDVLRFESLPGATATNVLVDEIGSWYAPGGSPATACTRRDAVDSGDGTSSLGVSIPPGSWVVVTASTPCGEGPAGEDSAGTERTTVGAWPACGPAP